MPTSPAPLSKSELSKIEKKKAPSSGSFWDHLGHAIMSGIGESSPGSAAEQSRPSWDPAVATAKSSTGPAGTTPPSAADALIQHLAQSMQKPTSAQIAQIKAAYEASLGKKTTSGGPSQQQLHQQISANDVWQQLGNSLVADQQKLEAPIEQAISGKDTAPQESNAATTALGALGLSPNSSASSWLNSQISQANANDSPMAQAMNEYGKAFTAGQQGIDSSLKQMGTANALGVQTAPEADWVSSLAQHVLSNMNYFGGISPQIASSIPAALRYYLGQTGAGGTTASGLEPLTNLSQGVNKSLEPPTTSANAAGSPGSGLPSPAVAAGGATAAGQNGIPSTPGAAPS